MINYIKVKDKHLYSSATKILNLAKQFDIRYADLENLKKFNGFSFEQQTN